jgi:small subunit ribosomal protein S4
MAPSHPNRGGFNRTQIERNKKKPGIIMLDDKCKKCRRAREKLFLKGEKCFGPKCSLTRKPYPPGIFGKGGKRKRSPRGLSEFGAQLREKQKQKFSYGLRERQFANYLKEAQARGGGNIKTYLYELLESRLDNVVFRMGFADSRSQARQLVSHGHIMVNGKRIDIPSYRTKKGDKISLRPQSVKKSIFKDLEIKIKKYNPPTWINLDKENKVGEIIGRPTT